MSASGVAVNFPGLPEYEKRTSVAGPSSGKDTKTEQLSQEQIDATAKVDAAAEKQKQAAIRQGDHGKLVAAAEVEGVERETGAADSAERMRTGFDVQAADNYIKWARQHTKDESERLAARPSPALFADSEGWDTVRKAIGLGLAGLGDAVSTRASIMSGHGPSGRNTVKDIIDMDIARQSRAIEKLKDNVAMARTGLTDAVEAKRALLADINLKGAEMYKRAGLLTKARLAGLKMDQASIDTAKEVADLERERANHFAEYVKSHSTSVTNRHDSAKTTTEMINRTPVAANETGKMPAQQSALAKQALNEIEKLETGALPTAAALNKAQDSALTSSAADTSIEGGKALSGTVALAGRALDVIPRNKYEGMSEQDRITFQTMDRAQQLLMHVMTGAGASMEEARKKAEAFGFVPGDSPAAMKAKLQGAKELAHQFTGAAPVAAPAGGAPGTTASPAPAPAPEFTAARVKDARAIASDANQPRAKRDRARQYIGEAAAAGVR